MIEKDKSTQELQADEQARRQATEEMLSAFLQSRPTAQEQVRYRSVIEGWGSPEEKKRVTRELTAFAEKHLAGLPADQPPQPLPAMSVTDELADLKRDLQSTKALLDRELLRLDNLVQEGQDTVSEMVELQARTLQGTGGTTIVPGGLLTEIHSPTIPPYNMAFSYNRETNTKITVRPGTLRITGKSPMLIGATELTLTGSVAWVYVEWDRSGVSPIVTFAASEPVSTGTHLRVPLYKFELLPSGTEYIIAQGAGAGILHIGDIQFDLPLS